ncbi:PREDICTED: WD repeat and HMG-box DNA-binding protein 1-like [Camelina sativa]|uniref:WD repeat and HMG-box DNA-binding protein 1-like n=1 Tax=Camelina sativa TaxID=90675 RepID=A0ABM0Y5J2_CAMSA|nr:PREDICTED: WD repeat and HMG-box DNA-binding protein 1-like [Camelina sativa]XP_010495877.1 PREDICTED: WD repeat and HMG-box DNA-binding protein 1-like [Camelina sativa]
MKSRSLKLREAHKVGGSAAFCSILWDHKAEHFVTSSSSDPSISVHDGLLPSTLPPTILRHHQDGVTALALSHDSSFLASGSIDHCVKLYKFPSGEFQTNITRFTLPIRVLAFNGSGSLLAAAGDDEGIKLINTFDGSIVRVLKGHKGPVTGLDFHPNGELLASIDSTGTVLCWELQNGIVSFTLKGVAPDTGFSTSIVNILRWSPDGRTLAVPGLRNDVVMYDRFTGEKLFALRGDHLESICYLTWAPNGKYIATSGLDKQVLLWDVDKKQDIDRHKFEERISCMAWKPNCNALSVIDARGKYGIWESLVPSSMISPTVGIPDILPKKRNEILNFDDEIEEELHGASESLNDSFVDSDDGESHHTSRKRLRKKTCIDDDGDAYEELNDGSSLPSASQFRKMSHRVHREKQYAGSGAFKSTAASNKYKMQSSFQPGATPLEPGKQTFLCYNMLGCITTIEHEGNSRIETDFHDTGRGPLVSSMIDFYGFTMASINESGCVFANPCKGEKNMSVLMYRPFRSWASNSEWTMRFEGEEVKVVANGAGWVAAVTSLNLLRIFSEGGLQKHILSLDGPVVTAVGRKDHLAVVTHVSDCLPSNEQVMEFRVLNISKMTEELKGRVALTPGSRLTWIGFSDEGSLSSYDSKGVLRVFTGQYGGSWIPVFSTSKEKKQEENYWVVGLNTTSVYCIACKHPEIFPQVTPKPILTILDLSLPLASSDLGAASLENELILKQLRLYETQQRVDDMALAGVDTTALEDEAFDMEVSQDKCILRLISSCCSSDSFVRASELMRLLTLEKSMRAAITLVTKLKLPFLAEKFCSILEERLLEEANEAITNPSQNPNREVVTRVESKVQNPPASFQTKSSATKLSATTFVRKAKVSEGLKLGKEQVKKDETEDVKIKEIKKLNLIKKPVNNVNKEDKGLRKEVNQEEARRSSNPFLKSTV